MQNEPNPSSLPFGIDVAERVKRLPPYLFGRINALKYELRRQGRDIIDLGMGNPTDVPDPEIIEKLCEAARDPRNHRYSVSNGLFNLRKEVTLRYARHYSVELDPDSEVIACLGSKDAFSHMCLALLGPGDTAIVPAPSFPVHLYAVALASANVLSVDCTVPDRFLSRIADLCQTLFPRPKVVVVNYPHNPTATVVEQDFFVELVRLARRYEFMVIHDFAYGDICFDGYRAPSFFECPRCQTGGCGNKHHEQRVQYGRLAHRLLRGQQRNDSRSGYHQSLLRLWHFPTHTNRRHHCATPLPRPRGAASGYVPKTTGCARPGTETLGLAGEHATRRHVRMGALPEPVARTDGQH